MEFQGESINGIDCRVTFTFRKDYFNSAKTEIKDDKIFTVGIVNQIRYKQNRDAVPQYVLDRMDAISISSGGRMTQGDIVFKVLDQSTLNYMLSFLKDELYTAETDPVTDFNSPFIGIDVSATDAVSLENDREIKYWDQLPPFDMTITALHGDLNASSKSMKLLDVTVVSSGFSESIDSLEMNDIVQFYAINGIEWFS